MIRASLEEVGPFRSIAIDGDGIVRAGNGVYEQAQALGLKVREVEAAPDELIAVKRPDLRGKQAERAAQWDNRAGETSEWDPTLMPEFDWLGMFEDEELDVLLATMPAADEWAGALELPDGDRAPFQQMTFTVSDEQAEQVKRALDKAKHMGAFVDTGNENGNGNALARVCEVFLGIS